LSVVCGVVLGSLGCVVLGSLGIVAEGCSVMCDLSGEILGNLSVKGWKRILGGVVLRCLRGVVLRCLRGVVLRCLRGVVLRCLRGVTRGRVIFWGFGVAVRGIISCGLYSGE
jgi:hypothetical protein